jgi:pyruvate/2-oxoglutarate dehydrogenase complex dihydrolipoamide acyltransferase (E2) component
VSAPTGGVLTHIGTEGETYAVGDVIGRLD